MKTWILRIKSLPFSEVNTKTLQFLTNQIMLYHLKLLMCSNLCYIKSAPASSTTEVTLLKTVSSLSRHVLRVHGLTDTSWHELQKNPKYEKSLKRIKLPKLEKLKKNSTWPLKIAYCLKEDIKGGGGSVNAILQSYCKIFNESGTEKEKHIKDQIVVNLSSRKYFVPRTGVRNGTAMEIYRIGSVLWNESEKRKFD